jgi:hypothetical protein
LESGTTPEQFKSIKNLIPDPDKKPDKDEDEAAKAAMLEAVKKAGADNPGADNQVAGAKDYMALNAACLKRNARLINWIRNCAKPICAKSTRRHNRQLLINRLHSTKIAR